MGVEQNPARRREGPLAKIADAGSPLLICRCRETAHIASAKRERADYTGREIDGDQPAAAVVDVAFDGY